MYHHQAIERYLQPFDQSLHCDAALVHVGQRLCQNNPLSSNAALPYLGPFATPFEGDPLLPGKAIQHSEAGIMPRQPIFLARIAQADDKPHRLL
jgi:hypothetical protein